MAAIAPVADVEAARAACLARDPCVEGIEMFVALEGVPGRPPEPTPSDVALARVCAAYLGPDPDSPGAVALALEVLAANHFEVGT